MKIFNLCSYLSAAILQQMTVLSTVFILDNMVHQNKWKLDDQKLTPLFADTYLHEIKVFLPKKPQPLVIKLQNFAQSVRWTHL